MARSANQSSSKGKNKGKKKDNVNKKASPEVKPSNSIAPTSSNPKADLSQVLQCGLCQRLNETAEWFIQCDKCDLHFHFSCVGITEIGEDEPWRCMECQKEIASTNVSERDASVEDEINEFISQESTEKEQSMVNKRWSSTLRIDLVSPPASKPNPATNQFEVEADVHVHPPEDKIEILPSNPPISTMNPVISTRDVHTCQSVDGIELQNMARQTSDENTQQESVEIVDSKNNSNAQRRTSTRIPSVKSTTQSNKSHHHTSRSKSNSRRTVSSNKSNREAELRYAEELLDLQTKLDAEVLNLKLEAVQQKARREKLFLEEKYKTTDNRSRSVSSKSTNRTSYVSSWVEEQFKRSQTQSLIENVGRFRSNIDKVNLHESAIFDTSKRGPTRARSLDENFQRNGVTSSSFDVEVSIPVESHERKNILRRPITETFGNVLKPISEVKVNQKDQNSEAEHQPIGSTQNEVERIHRIQQDSVPEYHEIQISRNSAILTSNRNQFGDLEFGKETMRPFQTDFCQNQPSIRPNLNKKQFGDWTSGKDMVRSSQPEVSENQRTFIPNLDKEQFGYRSSGNKDYPTEFNQNQRKFDPSLNQKQFGYLSSENHPEFSQKLKTKGMDFQ